MCADNLFNKTESFEDFIEFSNDLVYALVMGKLGSLEGTLCYGLDFFLTLTEILFHNINI